MTSHGNGSKSATGAVDPAALFHSLSDWTRLRLLRLLDREELNVQELVAVTGLSQPRVSKHLAVLREQGWVVQRKEGTWSWHRTVEAADFPAGKELFAQAVMAAAAVPQAARDDDALAAVLAERHARARDFFAGVADRWDEVRRRYEHPDLQLGMLAGLVPPAIRVLDIGTGTGAMLPIFSLAGAEVLALDSSRQMLARARSLCRAESLDRVRFCCADIERLPFAPGSFDAVNCAMVLHHASRPQRAVAEMARVLRPGGRLTLTTFCRHDQEWMRRELAHQWLGFAEDEVSGFMAEAGLEVVRRLQRPPLAQEVPRGSGAAPAGGRVDWPEVFLLTGINSGLDSDETMDG